MHFFLPPWLRHGRGRAAASVFSVDVEPYGCRLASGGQDCTVKIWSLDVLAALAISPGAAPSAGPAAAPGEPPPGALLASVSGHGSAVNCVRWAPGGKVLASGGDDSVVLIYEQLEGVGQSAAFGGGGGGGETENWRVRRPLRAHAGDVTDVCWSPDGEKLASASVDNVIYIWNVRAERVLVRLDGHRGLVKGVAWDPVGRFLASQSDDRTVRVWRTADWKTEKVISRPFDAAVYQENSMAFFLRLSWSPCGTQLLATNAFKKPDAHLAPMFSRESGFSEQIEFVGHSDPVVSTRFSPRLYRSHPKQIAARKAAAVSSSSPPKSSATPSEPPQDAPTYTCLALGSKDCGATVWQASGMRPFFEMAQMFEQDVIDLSWGTDGYTLVACSTDGKVMYIRFKPEELGVVVPQAEARSILTKVWREFGGSGANGLPLPESAAQLQMERAAAKQTTPVDDAMANTALSAAERAVDATEAAPVVSNDPHQSRSVPAQVLMASAAVRESGPTPPADPKIMAAQAEVRVRGGKRRITPMAVSAVAQPVRPAPGLQLDNVASPMKRPRHEAFGGGATNSPGLPHRLPVTNGDVPNGNGGGYVSEQKPKAFSPSLAVPENRIGLGASSMPPGAKAVSYPNPIDVSSVIGLSMMLLPETGEGPGRCRAIDLAVPPTLLEAREQHGSGGGYLVLCSKGGKAQWRDYHPKSSAITALAGISGKFASVASADGLLFLYSASSGRRLAPPIALDSAPHMLEALVVKSRDGQERWFVLVISRSALCSVFDVKAKKLVCARSAAPLLARPADGSGKPAQATLVRAIALGRITEAGEPILVMSDRHAFVYSRNFCAWLRVADDSSPNSEYARTLASTKKVGMLRSLQAGIGTSSAPPPALSGMSDLRRAAVESLAHLETLLEAAVALGSAEDYRYYLASYSARIAAAVTDEVENCENRLRELCDNLLNASTPTKDVCVLGMSGRELLKNTVLPIVSGNRALQRFVGEYSESLEEIAKRNA